MDSFASGHVCNSMRYLSSVGSALDVFFKNGLVCSYLVSFPSKKSLTFLVLVLFSGKTPNKFKTSEEVSA